MKPDTPHKIRFGFTLASIFSVLSLFAGEGMWLPLLLKSLNESEMKSMGMKMSAEDIYSINRGSLKDAIVHFGGFCTAEVISEQGLILTNHHCGYDAIQKHSTLEANYLQDGFWAGSLAEEKPNPSLFAQFIVSMHDVTQYVLDGVGDDITPAERQATIDHNSKKAMDRIPRESWQEIFVKAFYDGNQFFAFVTETYRDVRLVGTPPESIGKFGADTDNWVWPRHTGDFALFRIYAGPGNKPAEYSVNNKPLRPRHFLPVSMDGIDEGDFTMVFGFPGKTSQYLPSFAIAQTMDVIDPARIGVRNISLGIMDKFMRLDAAARLAYAAKYTSLSNSWKKWIGEMQGLKKTNAVGRKREQESEFMGRLRDNPSDFAAYTDLLPSMKKLYADSDTIIKNRTLLTEILGGANLELFKLTSFADRLINAYQKNGEEGYRQQASRISAQLSTFYKDYSPAIDMEIFDALMGHLVTTAEPDFLPDEIYTVPPENFNETKIVQAKDLYAQSKLTSATEFLTAMDEGGEYFTAQMKSDKAYQLYIAFKIILDTKVSPAYTMFNEEVQTLQKSYMDALMKVYPKKRFWPDANSTMRISYGKVEPYAPRDGMAYKSQTYLDGVIEKFVPGDYEFDVHPKLIELYEKKDFGPYGEHGKMPLAFIASNHTTGGNSGSPVIDAHGNLIGINFDRVWEGTMSDLYYDRSICRNIILDIRYILFVIDKFAGAGFLVEEMNLVHPKTRKKRKK